MIMQIAHLLHSNHLPTLLGGINDSTRRSRTPLFIFFIEFQSMTLAYDNYVFYHQTKTLIDSLVQAYIDLLFNYQKPYQLTKLELTTFMNTNRENYCLTLFYIPSIHNIMHILLYKTYTIFKNVRQSRSYKYYVLFLMFYFILHQLQYIICFFFFLSYTISFI